MVHYLLYIDCQLMARTDDKSAHNLPYHHDELPLYRRKEVNFLKY